MKSLVQAALTHFQLALRSLACVTLGESLPVWSQFPLSTSPAWGSDVSVLAFQPHLCLWMGSMEADPQQNRRQGLAQQWEHRCC